MKFVIALMATAILLLSGCTSSTSFGPCVGIADDKDPSLTYKLSIINTIVGVVFSTTLVVPVVVLANQTYCPVAKKK